jgi:stringent starvation protein B
MAFPVPVTTPPGEDASGPKPSPLSSVPAAPADAEGKIVQLVTPDPGNGPETDPPKPPAGGGPRPALKRIK